MDDFSATLQRDFGLRPQGKSAPMNSSGTMTKGKTSSGRANRNSVSVLADTVKDDLVFGGKVVNPSGPAAVFGSGAGGVSVAYQDAFGGPPKSFTSKPQPNYDDIFEISPNLLSSSNSKGSSPPVFEAPVFDDDILGGLPGMRSANVASDDAFNGGLGSGSEPAFFQDLLRGYGTMETKMGYGTTDTKGYGETEAKRYGTTQTKVVYGAAETKGYISKEAKGCGTMGMKVGRGSTETKGSGATETKVAYGATETKGYGDAETKQYGVTGTKEYGTVEMKTGYGTTETKTGNRQTDTEKGFGMTETETSYGTMETKAYVGAETKGLHRATETKTGYGMTKTKGHDTTEAKASKTSQSTSQHAGMAKFGLSSSEEVTHDDQLWNNLKRENRSIDEFWITVEDVKLVTQPCSVPPARLPPVAGSKSSVTSGKHKNNQGITLDFVNNFAYKRPSPTNQVAADSRVKVTMDSVLAASIDEFEEFASGGSRMQKEGIGEAATSLGCDEEQADESAAAAASSTAMKDALERAEARLKRAKETRERERGDREREVRIAKLREERERVRETREREERKRAYETEEQALEARKREEKERERIACETHEHKEREPMAQEEKEREHFAFEARKMEERDWIAREAHEKEEKECAVCEKEERERSTWEACERDEKEEEREARERWKRGREREREREKEREKDRIAVERAIQEARERAGAKAAAEVRERTERAAVERATADARDRAAAEARERAAERAAVERAAAEARVRAERAAVERATAEARERAAERAAVERATAEARERAERVAAEKVAAAGEHHKRENDLDAFFMGGSRASSAPQQRSATSEVSDARQANKGFQNESPQWGSTVAPEGARKAVSTTNVTHNFASLFNPVTTDEFPDVDGEASERQRARLERYQRTRERAAKALEEKNQRDLQSQREQAERHRVGEVLDVEIKRWAAGKEGNLRALLSTLQYVLWPESGWQPVSLADLITSASVKKVYRKATLCVHPDKVQQKGATIQHKYIAEKVFDLLKEAWNKFNSEELF